MADIPHFRHPFTRSPSGRIAVVEQDTPEHVQSCQNVIVRCPTGFREERPEFGWPFPEFRTAPLDLTELAVALRRFEPRAQHVTVAEWADAADAAIRHVQVTSEA
jgi:phage baseplate assembly protein W